MLRNAASRDEQRPTEALDYINLDAENCELRSTLRDIIETAGQIRMFGGRSYRKLWKLLDEATDRWFVDAA